MLLRHNPIASVLPGESKKLSTTRALYEFQKTLSLKRFLKNDDLCDSLLNVKTKLIRQENIPQWTR